MKKLFFSFLLLLFAQNGWSQATAGPILDLNFTNAIGGKGGNKFKMGFDAGLYLRVHFTEMVAVQPEILFSRKGYKRHTFYSVSGVTNDTNVTHASSYLNFPLLAHVVIGQGFIQVGPQVGFIINNRQTGEISITANGGTPEVQTVDTNTVYGFSTTEYSFVLGGGYSFPFGLSASLGLTYGLTKLFDTSYIAHNFSIGISVAYSLAGRRGSGASGGGMIRRKI